MEILIVKPDVGKSSEIFVFKQKVGIIYLLNWGLIMFP